uniref:HPr family phosphocarrier protein n=1 Tax=Eubacterium cellulosolvens TaxID=29322 RepID=UPI0004854E4E|nr:HPr family phosphocarrier protein [[Eubacterium] cellulosolvens]
MHEMNAEIKLQSPEEVKEFVNAASECDFDIDVWYNRIIVDAKSMLGVLSMDLRNAIHVRCYGFSQEFGKVLERFAVHA